MMMTGMITSACSIQPATVTIESTVDTAEAANGERPVSPRM